MPSTYKGHRCIAQYRGTLAKCSAAEHGIALSSSTTDARARTDVHVDDGILALTLALSPRANYSGGGTYFEHLGEENVLPMEQARDLPSNCNRLYDCLCAACRCSSLRC